MAKFDLRGFTMLCAFLKFLSLWSVTKVDLRGFLLLVPGNAVTRGRDFSADSVCETLVPGILQNAAISTSEAVDKNG